MQLQGKTAVITGAGGHIGAAAVRRFCAEGASVLAVDMDAAALDALAREMSNQPVSICAADVTDPASMQRVADTAKAAFGHVDAFLANAGIEGRVAPITETPLEDFERVMRVNVNGVFLGIQAMVPLMAEKGGSIVVTSSIAGLRGSPGVAPYVTSKHAVVGLMRSAAAELAAMNIRVNSVHPAPIRSRMMESLEGGMAASDEERQAVRASLESRIPLQRYGEPDEVADLMLYLCTDGARYLSGSTFSVDGGMNGT